MAGTVLRHVLSIVRGTFHIHDVSRVRSTLLCRWSVDYDRSQSKINRQMC